MADALRDYQSRLADDAIASDARCVVIQASTGSGKSHIIQHMQRQYQRTVSMVHASWLVDQLSSKAPFEHHVMKAGVQYAGSAHVVGMVQTISRRDLPEPEAVFVDEGHHAVSPTIRKIIDRWRRARIFFFTATPQRLDGQGMEMVADDLLCGPQTSELIERGYLKPFELYSVPSDMDFSQCRVIGGDYRISDQNEVLRKSSVFGDVYETWREHGRDGGHVSFWPSIEAAEHAAADRPGWHALHSKLPPERIKALLAGLQTGAVDSLATVGMVGEGLDVPGLASVSICRKTASLTNYLQWSGRANRGGAGVARILDHCQNWATHGMPDDDRTWTLKGRIKRKGEAGTISAWSCPECWAVSRSQVSCCPVCGTMKPREIRIIEERQAELELITRADTSDVHEVCSDPGGYLTFAKHKRKTPLWAALKWAERANRVEATNPFLAAAGDVRPTHGEFMAAALAMGIDEDYARIGGRKMGLLR